MIKLHELEIKKKVKIMKATINQFKKILFLLILASFFSQRILAMEQLILKKESNTKNSGEEVAPSIKTDQFQELFVQLSPISENKFALLFDQPKGQWVINYLFNDRCIGQLIQNAAITHFESEDPQYNFLLNGPLQADFFIVNTLGGFEFAQQVETDSASLKGESIKFFSKFSSKKDLALDVNYCDSFDDITCSNMLFKGNKLNVMSESNLNVYKDANILAKESFSNIGTISFGQNGFIDSSSFKNSGSLTITGTLHLNGKELLNRGSVQIGDSLVVNCDKIDHQGKIDIQNNCVFEKVGEFSSSEASLWQIGKDWNAQIANLKLDGKVFVGNLALFHVKSQAVFNGFFNSTILSIDSDGFITCNFKAELVASRHIGLKAKGLIFLKGNCYKQFLTKSSESASSESNLINEKFPQGVFITSEEGDIEKYGNIICKNGNIFLNAKETLICSGLTEAG